MANIGFENLAIGATAVGLTPPSGAASFVGWLETADVRMRSDGTAPTTTVGELIYAWTRVVLDDRELYTAKFIRTGSASAALQGHYYNEAGYKVLSQ